MVPPTSSMRRRTRPRPWRLLPAGSTKPTPLSPIVRIGARVVSLQAYTDRARAPREGMKVCVRYDLGDDDPSDVTESRSSSKRSGLPSHVSVTANSRAS
jgi:hypothetical protein